MTEPLSPTAQAVLDHFLADAEISMGHGLAAALQAAADQVAPSDAMEPRNYLPMAIECQRIRAELLAIAAELKGATNGVTTTWVVIGISHRNGASSICG